MKSLKKILAALAITILTICAYNVTFAAGSSEMDAEGVKLLNQFRQSKGLQPFNWNPNSALQSAAQLRAQEIVKNFSHTRPDGSSCFTVLNQYGLIYRTCGENIACDTDLSPAGAMDLWINSPGHYKNMVNPDYREVGVACYIDGENIYWVQLFFTGR